MATKLKNNKFLSEIIAACVVVAAVIVFMLQYGNFEKGAAAYRKEESAGEDVAVYRMLESNYILYKDIREKVDKTEYTYEDLYLTGKIRQTDASGEVNESIISQAEQKLASSIQEMKRTLAEEMRFASWESYFTDILSTSIDYCVIDKATGTFIKNTGNAIELLDEQTAESAGLPYFYYIKVEYDDVGHPGNIAVKSTDADKTLKVTQKMAKQMSLSEDENDIIGSNFLYGTYDEVGDREVEYAVDFTTIEPKNVTFVYAITPEQWNALGSEGLVGLTDEYNEMYYNVNAYYAAGVNQWYMTTLLMIGIIALLMPRYHKYRLQERALCKLPLELVCCIAFFVMFMFNDSVVAMVQQTMDGTLQKQIASIVPSGLAMVTVNIINVVSLACFFTVWYLCVTSFWEISSVGIRKYLAERSLVCRFWNRTKRFWMAWWHKFKTEMLDIELSRDNTKSLRRIVILHFIILFFVSCMWIFGGFVLIIYAIVIYFLMKKHINKIQNQYQRMLTATNSIAQGNLNTALNEDWGVFESYKAELEKIQEGFRVAVDEEVKSQRMKTELITNVSHDLKTPLTAMITYVDLLKSPETTEEERKEYIAILDRKSLRLKVLIEDLFEVSKANSKNISLDIIDVDIVGLMKQVSMELEEKMKDADLDLRWDVPDEKIILPLDSQNTYLIFENLYMNIIKYAMPSTRVYIKAEKIEERVWIELKNISAAELPTNPVDLTDRFVRGDASRNTEGSGLGLAIAKSFVELQDGKMSIETDGDLFKVVLEW